MSQRISEEKFIETWKRLQSAAAVAKYLGVAERNVHRRRRELEARLGVNLGSTDPRSPTYVIREHSPRVDCSMRNGVIVVGSDAHYWPGVISTAHQALVKVVKDLKPEIVVMNGDLLDGASISRHPRMDWGAMPTVKQELEAVTERLQEIKEVSGNAKTWWTLGNHDMRFEAKLANSVPEFSGVSGFSLKDHFHGWNFTISLFINKNLMIKHRFRNGTHATWNNTLHGGVSMCTGHLHRLQATILSDYRGTRWGIDCGTLAETDGDHMHYGEDNPTNHCSGFAVLTIVDGELIHPEFCSVHGEKAFFRGKQII
jgi:predicted MPP superfamily phosphohydrolase